MLFHEFRGRSALMNGKAPRPGETNWAKAPEPFQRVQVMPEAEIAEKRDPALWLARQVAVGLTGISA
jgi:hypothetical protein